MKRAGPLAAADEGHLATWHRLHPATLVVKGWLAFGIGALFVLRFFNITPFTFWRMPWDSSERWHTKQEDLGILIHHWGWFVTGLAGFAALIVLLSWLSWSRGRYRLSDEALHVDSGVIFCSRRQARVDRLQAVDISRPLFARPLFLAKLTVTMAGGEDATIELAYLRQADALALRAGLLARAAAATGEPAVPDQKTAPGPASEPASGPAPWPAPGGAAPGTHPGTPARATPQRVAQWSGPQALAPSERLIAEVPVGTLALSSLLSVLLIYVAVIVLIAAGALISLIAGGWRSLVWVVPVLMMLALTIGISHLKDLSRSYRFQVVAAPGALRISRGLTEKENHSVPLARISQLRIVQPYLWRSRGWWTVDANVAGYGAGSNDTAERSTLLPAGSLQQVTALLEVVLPGSTSAPGWPACLAGAGPAPGFTPVPRRARWLSPVQWRRAGYAITDQALWLRFGRLSRCCVIVPHQRTQSLQVRQGPWQRRLRLATFTAHGVPGPVVATLEHLDAGDAARLLAAQAARARDARWAQVS